MSPGGRMEFEFGFSRRPQRQRDEAAEGGESMRLLVAADFSGRASRGAREPLAGRHTFATDSDTIAAVMSGFESRIRIPVAWAPGGSIELAFESTDDLHPDALLARVPPLAALLECRRALDTGSAAAAAERLQALLGTPVPTDAAAPAATAPSVPPAGPSTESTEDTLARLLGRAPAARPAPAAGIRSIVQQIVGTSSSVVGPAPAGKAGLVAAAELALCARLREILLHPAFRTIERAWRGLDFLVRRCPDEERVRVFACDATPDELAADPAGLARLLRSHAFDLLVLDASFGGTADDLSALAAVAGACAAEGTTLAAGAHAGLVGCDNFSVHPDPDDWTAGPAAGVREGWTAFRALPQARAAVLGAPRFLARQVYGRAGDPIDSLPFEELPSPADPEAFPWAGAGVAIAQALAGQFVAGDNAAHPDGTIEIGDLPVARYFAHGGTAIMPCAEAWLSDRAVQRIVHEGLAALQAVKDSDTIRLHLPD